MTRKILYAFLLFCFSACNNSSKEILKNKKKFVPTTAFEKKQAILLSEKISLIAEGNTPTNWTMLFSHDDTIRFEANDGLKLNLPFNLLKKTNTVGVQNYTASIKPGNIKIIFNNQLCSLNIKNENFEKKVTFIFNDKIYEGCGNYLKDKNIEGKWILEKINNSLINNSEYYKSPFIEINLTKNRIEGNDGCNNFNSKIEMQGNRIQFNEITYSINKCSKKTIESIINEHINNHLVDYYSKEGKLYFYLEDDSLLIFKRP